MPGLIAADYLCPEHGRFDSLEERDATGLPPAERPCVVCGAPSSKVFPLASYKPQRGAVKQGKEEPRDSKLIMDTRPLADGMPYDEWKAGRDKMFEDIRYRKNKEFLR